MSHVQCERCHAPCGVSRDRDPKARLLRHADKGLCANCATTAFLKATEPLSSVIAAKGAAMLLDPRVADHFASVMAAGNADASPAEIHWPAVVEWWDEPFPKVKARR